MANFLRLNAYWMNGFSEEIAPHEPTKLHIQVIKRIALDLLQIQKLRHLLDLIKTGELHWRNSFTSVETPLLQICVSLNDEPYELQMRVCEEEEAGRYLPEEHPQAPRTASSHTNCEGLWVWKLKTSQDRFLCL